MNDVLTGWTHAASDAPRVVARLAELRKRLPFELREIIVCGMGGSALAAYVLKSLHANDTKVRIRVLDTTALDYVARVSDEMDGAGTLVIVASKSGSTLEPNVLSRLLKLRLAYTLGSARAAAQHFIALTDAQTSLDVLAREEGWLEVVTTPADVGGRYSALTAFGLAPSVLAGIDVSPLIARAQEAEGAARLDCLDSGEPVCSTSLPAGTPSTSALLADFLVAGAESGRDVVLLALPEKRIAAGRWLEQLIAESLGKEGRGLVPVVTTPERAEELLLFSPKARAVVAVVSMGNTARVAETARALGVATFEYPFCEVADLGALFVDWEFAVANCGKRLGVNPFDQPDVAASKAATDRILAAGVGDAALGVPPAGKNVSPFVGDAALGVPPAGKNVSPVVGRDAPGAPPVATLQTLALLAHDPAIHYLALLAWAPYSKENDARLQRLAIELERACGIPVATGYGPRYLHSTGQVYKGGPATGLFLFTGGGESKAAEDDSSSGAPGASRPTGPLPPGPETADAADDLQELSRIFTAQRQGDIEALAAKDHPSYVLP